MSILFCDPKGNEKRKDQSFPEENHTSPYLECYEKDIHRSRRKEMDRLNKLKGSKEVKING